MGIPSSKIQKKVKKKYEASTQIHGRTKQDTCAYEVLRHELQMENNVLTRIPMEGRLYHIKYDTLINKES
jgi:hypothetical protein